MSAADSRLARWPQLGHHEQLAPLSDPDPDLVDRIRDGLEAHKRRLRDATPMAIYPAHHAQEL